MAIIIQDITPRIQYVQGAGPQNPFVFPWPMFSPTDINVYVTPVGTVANDVTNILIYNIGYTVTINAPPAVGGTVTIIPVLNIGDIVTLARNQPDNRLDNYIDGGLFQASQVNTDFDRTVLMAQQNKMYDTRLGLHYNVSAVINSPIVDNVLPVLPPNCVWMKNAANTAIVAVTSFNNGTVVVLPTIPGKIAYFTDTLGTLQSSLFSIPLADAPARSLLETNGAGQLQFSAVTFPAGVGVAGEVLMADGAGNLVFAAAPLGLETVPGINRIINGDFQVWQRGAGGAATFVGLAGGTTTYCPDRWQVTIHTIGNSGYCRQIAGATSGSYVCNVARTNGTAVIGGINICTSLTRDMCIGAAGNFVTVSFKAYAGANFSAAGGLLGVVVYSGTGAADISGRDGSFVGSVAVINQNAVLNNVLTQFTFTSAAVIGANVTQLAAQFSFIPVGISGADDGFYITDVQLEISQAETPFQRLDFEQQLLRCQRFYAKSFLYGTAPVQNAGAGSAEEIFPATKAGALAMTSATIDFPVAMLSDASTVTTFNPSAANAEVRDETVPGDCSATAVVNLSARGFVINTTGNAGGAVGDTLGVHWTSDCDVV